LELFRVSFSGAGMIGTSVQDRTSRAQDSAPRDRFGVRSEPTAATLNAQVAWRLLIGWSVSHGHRPCHKGALVSALSDC